MAYVSMAGKTYVGQIGADVDEKIPGLKKIADAIKNRGSVPVLQLSFGGRIAQTAAVLHDDVIGPSDVPGHQPGMATPRPMTDAEIPQSIADFG